jgi:polyvinyl alcohol dehydrogenase (cytochrome)
MTVGPVQGQGTARQAVYYGDLMANVYALDAQTGRLLWTRKVERNYTQRVTAAPALYQGRLYVPVSSWEEISAATASYPCCTAVGSVVALNANSGRQLWKTYVIPERPRIVGHNAVGTPRWAPAGGAVWNTPTLDPKRRAVYFGTGDGAEHGYRQAPVVLPGAGQ